jgi:predicted signal transduction protein with EAL and GGDEF domain
VTGEAFGAMALAIALAGLIVITSGAFALLMDRDAQRARAQELSLLASTDALTGLANRAAFRCPGAALPGAGVGHDAGHHRL